MRTVVRVVLVTFTPVLACLASCSDGGEGLPPVDAGSGADSGLPSDAASPDDGAAPEAATGTPPPCGPDYGADEPRFDADAGTLVLRDDMDGYASTADLFPACKAPGPAAFVDSSWLNCSNAGPNTTHVQTIAPGRGGAGKALRLVYDGVNQESPGLSTNPMATGPTAAVQTMYVSHCARLTPAAPLGSQAVAFKFILFYHQNYDRIQFNTHDHLPWSGGSFPTYWQVYDGSRETVSQGDQALGPHFNEDIAVPGATWHRFTYAYRQNTTADNEGKSLPFPASSRDGFARMWIDGTKVIDISQATVGVTPQGGEKPWCTEDDVDALSGPDGIIRVAFGGALTAGHTAFTFDIDDFAWWTQ